MHYLQYLTLTYQWRANVSLLEEYFAAVINGDSIIFVRKNAATTAGALPGALDDSAAQTPGQHSC